MYTQFLLENLIIRDHSEDLGIDGRIILACILEKWVGSCGLDASDSGQGPVADSCEHAAGPSGSIKVRDFLD
jgi:hypothetical protein